MMTRAILLGNLVGAAIFAAGTILTLYWATDGTGGTLDPYKVGGTWLILGAIAGRIVFNVMTPKPVSSDNG